MKLLVEHRVVGDMHIATPKMVTSASDLANRKAMMILEKVRFFNPYSWTPIDMAVPVEYYTISDLEALYGDDTVTVDSGTASEPVRSNITPANILKSRSNSLTPLPNGHQILMNALRPKKK